MKNQTTRVVLCSYPGIFADTVIQALQKIETIEIVGLVYSERIFSAQESWLGAAFRLIKLSGISYAALQFIQTDLYLILRKIFRRVSIESRLPVYRTKNINTEMGLDFLKKLRPDVILLANFNQKVSSAVISLPKLACLNIHPSLLPKFKGVDPVFAAIYANQPLLGVSVHQVDEDFDTGNIIAQNTMQNDENRSVFYHQQKLFAQGGILAVNIIKHLPNSLRKHIENATGDYDSWPTAVQINTFQKRGGRLIKWRDYLNAVKNLL